MAVLFIQEKSSIEAIKESDVLIIMTPWPEFFLITSKQLLSNMNGKIIKTFHPRGPRTIEGWFDTLIQIDGELDSDVRTLAFETRHGQSLIKPIMVELDRSLLWLKPLP